MTSAVPRKGVYGGVYGGRGRGGYGGYREKSEANAETKAETQPKADSQPEASEHKTSKYTGDLKHKDNSFREFRRLVARIEEDGSSLAKTEKIRKFFSKGSDGSNFVGDLHLWVKLLVRILT